MISMKFTSLLLFLLTLSSFELLADRPMIILVHPFKNNGDAKYSWVSAGLSESVTHDLRTLDGVTIISQDDRRRALQELKYKQMVGDNEEGVEVANLMGADVIFTGSYSIVDDETRIMAKITKANDGSLQKSIKLDGKLSEIHSIQDQIVIGLLKESESIKISNVIPKILSREETQKYQERPKPKFSAFELYSKGAELLESNPQQALVYMREALGVDPNYVNALLGAGGILEGMNKQWESSEYILRASPLLEKQGLYASGTLYKSVALLKRNQNKEAVSLLKAFTASHKLDMNGVLPKDQVKELISLELIYYYTGLFFFQEKKFEEANENLQIARQILDRLGLHKTYDYMDVLNIMIIVELADMLEEGELQNLLSQKEKTFTSERKETVLSLGNDFYNLTNDLGIKYDETYAFSYKILGDWYCRYLRESYPVLLFKFVTFQKSNRQKGAEFYTNSQKIYVKLNKYDIENGFFLINFVRESLKNPYLNLDEEKIKEYFQLAKNIADSQKNKKASDEISTALPGILDLKKDYSLLEIISKILLLVMAVLTVVLIGAHIFYLNHFLKADKNRFEELQNKRDRYKKSEKERNLLSKKQSEEYEDTLYSLESKIIKEKKSLKKNKRFLLFLKVTITLFCLVISYLYLYIFY